MTGPYKCPEKHRDRHLRGFERVQILMTHWTTVHHHYRRVTCSQAACDNESFGTKRSSRKHASQKYTAELSFLTTAVDVQLAKQKAAWASAHADKLEAMRRKNRLLMNNIRAARYNIKTKLGSEGASEEESM